MSLKIIINCNTSVKSDSEKELLLESNNIPFEISGDTLYFLSSEDIEFSTNDSSDFAFIIDMLSDMPKFNVGGDFSNVKETIQKTLIQVFQNIQLDINLIDSYSGESDWLDFRLNEDLTFDYLFESDDD
jgi:hypothetical protein